MRFNQAIIPFFRLLFVDLRGILRALLRYTKEAYRKIQFGNTPIKYVDLLEVVGSMDEMVKSYTYLDGTSRTSDIAFLRAVCRQYKDCKYLEIGSWRGESLLNVAEVAEKCVSVTLSKEEMMMFGMSAQEASVQLLLSRGIRNVEHIEANSMSFDFESLDDKFDVIFIDGDHSYQGVKSDTINALKLLRDEKSVIIWHDCGFSMQDLRYESITAIRDACSKAQFDKFYRVSNTMCGLYTHSNLKAAKEAPSSLPNKLFDVHLTSKSYTE